MIRRLLLGTALAALVASGSAVAQVSPSQWTQNYTPTLSDWQAALLYNGQSFSQAMGGKLSIGAESDTQLVTGANSIAASTMPRTLAERAMSMPQPGDFLSSGQTVAQLISGQIDVGPIMNAMISAGVLTIHLPCGTYKLATQVQLANNVSISGDGACTILSVQTTAGDVISGASVQYTRVHDLTMQADVNRTSGGAITLHNSFENRISDVWFTAGTGAHWTDIYLDGANGTHIDRVSGRGANWDGIIATGTSQRSEDTYVSNSTFDGYGGAPIELAWASGVYLSRLDLLGGKNAGVFVDPASPAEVDGVRATAVLADSNYGPGWRLDGSGAITEFNVTNCWGSTNGIGGNSSGFVALNPAINDLTIASSEFHANTNAGIDIENGNRITISGNMVFMNSLSGSAVAAGINIGANPNFLVVTYNQSGAGGEAQGNASQSLQSYGIVSAQPASNTGHYALFGNNMATGNQTGGYSIATGTNVTTSNNVGF